jgi:hypothetical protein
MTAAGRPDRNGAPMDDQPEAPPPTVPIDPHGDDPAHIPDPMPDDLRRAPHADRALEEAPPMEGDAPSG